MTAIWRYKYINTFLLFNRFLWDNRRSNHTFGFLNSLSESQSIDFIDSSDNGILKTSGKTGTVSKNLHRIMKNFKVLKFLTSLNEPWRKVFKPSLEEPQQTSIKSGGALKSLSFVLNNCSLWETRRFLIMSSSLRRQSIFSTRIIQGYTAASKYLKKLARNWNKFNWVLNDLEEFQQSWNNLGKVSSRLDLI